MNPADVHGKRLAMIAWSKKPDGEDDVSVFAGIGNWDGKCLTMLREEGSIDVLDDWWPRLKHVPPDLKSTLLGADYHFSILVGALDDDHDPAKYKSTGLRWPGHQDLPKGGTGEENSEDDRPRV